MANEMTETVIAVLVACTFGTLLGVLYQIGKLQEAINEIKKAIEK